MGFFGENPKEKQKLSSGVAQPAVSLHSDDQLGFFGSLFWKTNADARLVFQSAFVLKTPPSS
jgi:hypothetical protein